MLTTSKQILLSLFTIIIYTLIFNWQLAILIAITIGWHEACHLLAAKYLKLKTSGFTLLPFVGGVSFVSEKYKSYGQQAFVVLAGPLGGGILGVLVFISWLITGASWLAISAQFMLVINLFNLLPLSSIVDGGQLMGTVSYSINKTLGMVLNVLSTLVAIVVIWDFNPVIALLIVVFGGSAVVNEIKNWNNFRQGKTWLCSESYLNPPKALTTKELLLTIGGWILTAGVLILVLKFLSNYPESAMSSIFHM